MLKSWFDPIFLKKVGFAPSSKTLSFDSYSSGDSSASSVAPDGSTCDGLKEVFFFPGVSAVRSYIFFYFIF